MAKDRPSFTLEERSIGHGWACDRAFLNVKQSGIPRVLQRFQAIAKSGRIDGPSSGDGYDNAYKWEAGADETLRVLPLIWPWLGIVKRVQAIEAIKGVDALPVLRRHPWRDEARRFTQTYTESSGISFAP